MFGLQEAPFEFEEGETKISLQKEDEVIHYKREDREETLVEMNIVSSNEKILFSPVEPLNIPKQITSSLLIEFENPVVLASKKKTTFYLTFPVEVGVFMDEEREPIDIFTFSKSKYTLYGDVKKGEICKYWNSPVRYDMMEVDTHSEGILKLTIANTNTSSIEIHMAVFSGYGMKIFYDEDTVCMNGKMIVKDEDRSITDFFNRPLRKGMKRARDIYEEKKIPLKAAKYLMEGGI
ncbi:MAG: DUF432 domain-containing protein [Candidatus Natronoplasma sp.]